MEIQAKVSVINEVRMGVSQSNGLQWRTQDIGVLFMIPAFSASARRASSANSSTHTPTCTEAGADTGADPRADAPSPAGEPLVDPITINQ